MGRRVVIDSSGERMKLVHEQLREKRKPFQLVWKVSYGCSSTPLAYFRFLNAIDNVDYAFQLCDEMSLYTPLPRQHDIYNTRHVDELLADLCTLYKYIGDSAFEVLRAHPGFEKLRTLAGSVRYFRGEEEVEGGFEGRYLRWIRRLLERGGFHLRRVLRMRGRGWRDMWPFLFIFQQLHYELPAALLSCN
ncbi:hypothetical protein BDQ17DRAFT_1326762 [Cyathus striatus]|nr:hypothetical protein BDQ17DRAFT_1326762 [Cyathus striatus]